MNIQVATASEEQSAVAQEISSSANGLSDLASNNTERVSEMNQVGQLFSAPRVL